jgi:hypothetical protein
MTLKVGPRKAAMTIAKPKTPRSARKPRGKLAERPQKLSRAPALRLDNDQLIRRAMKRFPKTLARLAK